VRGCCLTRQDQNASTSDCTIAQRRRMTSI